VRLLPLELDLLVFLVLDVLPDDGGCWTHVSVAVLTTILFCNQIKHTKKEEVLIIEPGAK